MIKFDEFLKEQASEMIEVDPQLLENNRDDINADLDKLTEKPYQNSPIFLSQLRGCLERYGMMLPAAATVNFLNLGAELVYMIPDTPYHLYIVYDTNEDGFVDGYAQLVTDDELSDLINMDSSNVLDRDPEVNPVKIRPSTWYAPREDDG